MSTRRFMDTRMPVGPVRCGECATVHGATVCPECGEHPDGVDVGMLQTEVITEAGTRWTITAERDPDSGGWVPVGRRSAGWLAQQQRGL